MALVVIEPFHCISNSFTLVVTFMAVNVAMMVVMVYGVARCYGHGLKRSWFLFPLVLGFSPFVTTLHYGEINVITEFGIFLAFIAETALPVVAGAGLALGICTKVTPVALLGYYLVNKRFKAIAATLAAVAVLCAIAAARYGWTPFFTYARLFPTLPRVDMPGPFSMSLVARLGVEESAAQSVQTALTMYVAAIVLLAGVLRLHHQAAGTPVHRGLPGGDAFPQRHVGSPFRVLSDAAAGLDGVEQFQAARSCCGVAGDSSSSRPLEADGYRLSMSTPTVTRRFCCLCCGRFTRSVVGSGWERRLCETRSPG